MTGAAVSEVFPAAPYRIRFKGTAVARVESLDYEGRGVAHVDGKATFIEGALPGEEVRFGYLKKKRDFDKGLAIDVLSPSPERIRPACPYFGVCGGCSLQYLQGDTQITAKQRIVAEMLSHLGKVAPEQWLAPLTGPLWGYRRKARLGVRWVEKKGGVLVGFREKRNSFVADINTCKVLDPRVATQLPALRHLIGGLSCPRRIPQIEVAVGDHEVALVFRHLQPLMDNDLQRLRAFGKEQKIHIHLQPAGPDSIHALEPDPVPLLGYSLPGFDIQICFRPLDFTQVNADINRLMVNRAVELLETTHHDRVLELFCGLGNFSLPMARRAGAVLGIEGEATLVDGARKNARRNGITNASFRVGDLYDDQAPVPWEGFGFDKLLLDPPRAGAMEIIKRLPEAGPERIVYVSCDPGTLALDSQYLVHTRGYRIASACVMDMFPQTSHVETMALFVRDTSCPG